MIVLLAAIIAGYGMHLMYSSAVFGWAGLRPGPRQQRAEGHRIDDALDGAGLGDLDPRALMAAMVVLAMFGFALGTILFAGPLAGLVLALFAATTPLGAARLRHERKQAQAHAAWPSLIEEIRLLTGTLGRSIPQATFEVGARAPEGLNVAFAEAQREWLISTDFARALEVLKAELAHNTADIVAETLLTAHELGGGEVGRRLQALAEDRLTDQQHRRDAAARQAGVRFARWFVLVVPFGMALAGLSIGNGRDAYGTGTGQALVVFALALIITCWVWAGRIMRLPTEERVFG
jgi:tight adherence protein B